MFNVRCFNSQDVDSEEELDDTVHVITENEKVVGELRLQFTNTFVQCIVSIVHYRYCESRHVAKLLYKKFLKAFLNSIRVVRKSQQLVKIAI